MFIRKLLLCLVFCCLFFVAFGSPADSSDAPGSRSLVTYFRAGVSRFEPSYRGNSERMLLMRDFLRGLSRDSLIMIDSLVIRAAASPEGNPEFNQRLSDQRAAAIRAQVVSYFPELSSKIITYSLGEDWEGLYRAVTDDPNVPDRKAVLGILQFSSSRKVREFFLRDLRNGIAWSYIAANILPKLRSGVSTLVHYRRLDEIKEDVFVPVADSAVVHRDTIYITVPTPIVTTKIIRDTIYITTPAPIKSPSIFRDTVFVSLPSSSVSVATPSGIYADSLSWRREDRPVWALKTNLMYWAALQGNVEAEFYIGDRWSLNFEYQVAWWSNPSRHQYYQYMQCGPEGRYWFKGDGQFRGHYVGIHVGFGLYDLSWGIPKDQEAGLPTYPDYQGYQGEFAIALGISYGHVWKIGKSLNLELGLGFGYIMTEYRRYNYQDTHYVYQATERMQFVGPTKARLALLWQFGRGAGKGARR